MISPNPPMSGCPNRVFGSGDVGRAGDAVGMVIPAVLGRLLRWHAYAHCCHFALRAPMAAEGSSGA